MPDGLASGLLPGDGFVIVAKRDCPTCVLIEPVMQSLDRAGPLAGVRIVEIDAIGPVPLAAMLLGILYHTLLAFTGAWWIVEDPHPHAVYAWLLR